MQSPPPHKAQFRTTLRAQRSMLSPAEQETKAHALREIVTQLPIFLESQHIAAYWPSNGEINPLEILQHAVALGKSCYLPCVHPEDPRQLAFVRYTPGDPLHQNRLGIQEPLFEPQSVIHAQDLDLVLTPLIGFGAQGQRLGMGKGYYDRAFAFLNKGMRSKGNGEKQSAKPYLLGLAYAFQFVDQLPADLWDVALNGVATEQKFIEFLL